MTTPYTLKEFRDWAAEQDPDRTYSDTDLGNCPLALFYAADLCRGQFRPVGWHKDGSVAQQAEWAMWNAGGTYGGLVARLNELIGDTPTEADDRDHIWNAVTQVGRI